ncbi:hypothetical protein RFI_19902 [Reticulomyxa filosa]|uniref:Uncharacterized protein n=1 Tax=Reticulomyxa filosa TaxID=46433 RepID=X6MWH5_RETFI|nr:hypothetical protein RFI_19902 [Reticulomyxa filosa]|eukprot:ETO17420.1 hypothetical protein RFI_19902 [Reticulomyxa filosa]
MYDGIIKNKQGTRLRQEAGYLCEIISWEIMKHNCNLWYDSSFRYRDFFKTFIGSIRAEYGSVYKIALLSVRAQSNTIFERAKRRATVTYRHVPEEDIQASIDQVTTAISELSPLMDLVIEINNNEDAYINAENQPKIVSLAWNQNPPDHLTKIKNPTWDDFAQIWYNSNGTNSSSPQQSKL